MNDVPSHRPRWLKALPLIASVLAIFIGVLLIARPAFLPATTSPISNNLTGQIGNGLGQLPREGEVVRDFQLKTLDGGMVKISDLRGSPVLINFWATWCGPCKEEMPLIVEQYDANKGRGLRVLAIDSVAFDDLGAIHTYVDKYKMTFDVLLDEDDKVSSDWAIMGLPSSVFVRPDGTIAKVHVGQMTADQLKDYLQVIMPSG